MRYNFGKLQFLRLLYSMDSHKMIARQRKIYFGGVCVIILSGILFPFWRGTSYNEDIHAREIRQIFNPNFRRPSPSLQDRHRFRTWSRAGKFGLDGTNDLVFNIAPIWKPPTKADASFRWPWQSVSQRMYVEIDLPRLLFCWSTELIVLGLFVGGFGWNYPKGNDNMVLLVSGPVTMGSIVGWILGTLLPIYRMEHECTDSLIIGIYLFPILVGLVAGLASRSWASTAKDASSEEPAIAATSQVERLDTRPKISQLDKRFWQVFVVVSVVLGIPTFGIFIFAVLLPAIARVDIINQRNYEARRVGWDSCRTLLSSMALIVLIWLASIVLFFGICIATSSPGGYMGLSPVVPTAGMIASCLAALATFIFLYVASIKFVGGAGDA